MDKIVIADAIRATEAGAIAAARLMGRGDRDGADQAAVTAMRKAMDDSDISGTIVIGEGERDEAPMLFIGEQVGNPDAATLVDIAVDPLEGTNLVATGSPNATAVLAAAEPGGLMHAPDTYLEKLIVGPMVAGHVNINDPVSQTLGTIAERLSRNVWDLTIVILDRPRHERLIAEVRAAGARIKLISDGDLTAAISVAVSGTGVHAVHGHRRRAGRRAFRRSTQVPWRRDPGQVPLAQRRGARACPDDGRRRGRYGADLLHRRPGLRQERRLLPRPA